MTDSGQHGTGISVVIPALNEAENMADLHREVVDVCRAEGYDYEIIYVDDGSTDNTREVAETLSPLTYIRLRRNFGQTAAMDCGIKHASKEFIVTMDGDGQNDPADIPRLMEEIQVKNLDIVSGWRKKRKDPIRKKIASRLAAGLRKKLINDGIHDSGCSLKIYRRNCFEGINLYGEMHRFIPAVLRIKGFRVGEIEVNHRPRTTGRTKYNWRRGVKGLIDMVSVWFWHKYAVRPLHLLGGLGLLSVLAGVVIAAIGIWWYIAGIILFRNVLPIAAMFFLLMGLQLFVFGLVADMMAKSYFRMTDDSSYSVAETIRTN